MASRLSLQTKLEALIGSDNVYYQPPPSIEMEYPAIKYSINDIENEHADNSVYKQNHRYELTVIDSDPDSVIVDAISKVLFCKFNRHYKINNLNHTVFTLYY